MKTSEEHTLKRIMMERDPLFARLYIFPLFLFSLSVFFFFFFPPRLGPSLSTRDLWPHLPCFFGVSSRIRDR